MIPIDPSHLELVLRIEAGLPTEQKVQLINHLAPTDMTGINPSIVCHQLAIKPLVKLVKQKPRKMNAKQCQAFSEEVDRLLHSSSSRKPSTWTSSPILYW